ncbi:quinol dehydrogenase ferredoxin subunit NapH [Neomegalonema sp.]|uniref:quinol dehydrogenase ferredoxin subunit NapH n=1 Tax=Neomegalonema sp. TaxID=2039713 RepID=UPI00262601F0|nr:quinol dehydrogenase ferredoxin subunit NapH [Neomegalonema sp.]MDD2867337.1 quinol dehydrogenase ferredoxin subunit NapH [Neomegalonema sp.]
MKPRPGFRLTAESRALGIEAKGVLRAHKWWLLRRTTQVCVILIFALSPVGGYWIARGDFASSRILGLVSFSDPYIFLQTLAAGAAPVGAALTGALLVGLLYLVVGGRAYCSWVCPVNVVTDAAHWLREKLGVTRDRKLDRRTRLWILLATFLAAFGSSAVAWEFVNPVSLLQRGLIFGMGLGWAVILAVFLLDFAITRRGWCGHLCPVGAFYGLIGKVSLTRVSAARREDCTNCGACFNVCPEPHVITPALKGEGTRLVLSGDCVNCGGCIDVCPVDVFEMASRARLLNERRDAAQLSGS